MRLFRTLPGLALTLLVGASLVLFLAPLGDPGGPEDSDKVAHLGIFATLALAGCWARLPVLRLGLGLAVYAALVEVVQGTVTVLGRAGDVRDLAADLVGIGVGLAVAAVLGLVRGRSDAEEPSGISPRG
ncbi:VanZ family protein [Nocardioides nanhaiensis]|uniref:VanZ family protein n=1 Tax=Nocardioides nanhaiensis TaxID=1476871 RepID=A0ABP8VXM5_9ACTN